MNKIKNENSTQSNKVGQHAPMNVHPRYSSIALQFVPLLECVDLYFR